MERTDFSENLHVGEGGEIRVRPGVHSDVRSGRNHALEKNRIVCDSRSDEEMRARLVLRDEVVGESGGGRLWSILS